MPKLVLELPNDRNREFNLRGEPAVIGRGSGNAVVLDDTHCSRQHAEVRLANGAFVIRDLGSSNGTFVNGKKVEGDKRLLSGDIIELGHTKLVYDPLNASSVKLMPSRGPESAAASPVACMPAGDEGTLIGFNFDQKTESQLEDPMIRLKLVYHYADVMRRCLDLHGLVEYLLDALFQVVEPDRGAVLLRNRKTGEMIPAGSRMAVAPGRTASDPINISGSIVARCVRDRISVVTMDAAADARFNASESIIFSKIGSAICCPLISGEEVYGIVYVDTVHRFKQFSEQELELATGIANQAAMAVGNAVHHEQELEHREVEMQLAVARRIHDRLLPDQSINENNVAAFGWNRPCTSVGGDYFGVFRSSQGPLFAIGDSTGHGIGAALMMTTARAYLVSSLDSCASSPSELMTTLNRLLARDMDPGMFVSFLLMRIENNGRQLRYVMAGHEPPLLFRSSTGQHIDLEAGGIVLGLAPSFQYCEGAPCELMAGDMLCLFTDGLAEQVNASGEEFGIGRLKDAVARFSALQPKEACDAVIGCLDAWRGQVVQSDDYTLLLVKIS